MVTHRAEYYVEASQQSDALRDCNTALALDKRCVAAYALRSKLNPPIESLSEDPHSEEKSADTPALKQTSKASERAELLSSAARDALAAFLIGGSSDLSYAAAAEEAARESCRISARQIFEDRRSVSASKKTKGLLEEARSTNVEDSFPRAWLVQSFFAGYESYRTAFGLENMPPEDEIIDEEGDMNEVIKSHTKDLEVASALRSSHTQNYISKRDSSSSCEGGDIDEEVKSSSVKLPLPPAHLTDGEHSLDPLGYYILRCLVGRLEGTQEPGPEELEVLQASEDKKNAAGHVEILGGWMGEAEKMWADLCAEEDNDNVTDSESAVNDQDELMEERADENDKVDKEYLSVLSRLGLLEDEASDRIAGFRIGLKMGGRGSTQMAQPVLDLSKESYIPVSHSHSTTDLKSDFDIQTVGYDLVSQAAYTVCEGPVMKASSFPSSGGRTATPPSSPPCPAFKWCLQLLMLPEVSALTGVTFAPSGTVIEVKPLKPASPEEKKAVNEAEEKEEEVENLRIKEEKSSGAKNFSWARQEAVKEDDDDDDEGWEDCDDDDEEEDGDNGEEWEDCDDEDDGDEDEDEEDEEGVEEKEIADLRKNIRGVKMGWCAESGRPKVKSTPAPTLKATPTPTPAPAPIPSTVAMTSDSQPSVDSVNNVLSPIDSPVIKATPTSVMEDLVSVTAPIAVEKPSPTTVKLSESDIPSPPQLKVEAEVAEREASSISASLVSRSLHACLLSVCSSIAYLSGDALGAVKCLRASIQENITAGKFKIHSSNFSLLFNLVSPI